VYTPNKEIKTITEAFTLLTEIGVKCQCAFLLKYMCVFVEIHVHVKEQVDITAVN
jgi:hypothetical protein